MLCIFRCHITVVLSALVDLGIDRQIVADGGPEVCELADHIKFVVVDGDAK